MLMIPRMMKNKRPTLQTQKHHKENQQNYLCLQKAYFFLEVHNNIYRTH